MAKKRRSNNIISIIAALLLASITFAWMKKNKEKDKNKDKDRAKTNSDKQSKFKPDFSHFSKEWVELIEKEYKMLYHHWQQEESKLKKTFKHLHDLFIPHSGNQHKPKALSAKWLKFYAVVLIAIKLLVVGFLFFTYPNPAKLSQQVADELFVLTNQSRAELGLPELAYNEVLAQAAQAKANDMVAKGYFAHIGPDGKKPWEWIDRGRYPFIYMGENLAMDFTTAEVIHLAFKKSPSHWKNVTNPKYRDIGIGVATGIIDGRETTVLVQFFGGRQAVGPQLAAATTNANQEKQDVSSQPPAPEQANNQEQTTQVAGVEKENLPPDQTDSASSKSSPTEPTSAEIPAQKSKEEKKNIDTPTRPNLPDSTESVSDKKLAEQDSSQTPQADAVSSQPVATAFLQAGVARVNLDVSRSASDGVSGSETLVKEENQQPSQKLAKEFLPPPQFDSSDRLVVATITTAEKDLSLVDYVILFSRYFFLVFMVVMFILLVINVLVHPHVQHGHVIMQTIAIIILSGALLLTRFHILENLPTVIIY